MTKYLLFLFIFVSTVLTTMAELKEDTSFCF